MAVLQWFALAVLCSLTGYVRAAPKSDATYSDESWLEQETEGSDDDSSYDPAKELPTLQKEKVFSKAVRRTGTKPHLIAKIEEQARAHTVKPRIKTKTDTSQNETLKKTLARSESLSCSLSLKRDLPEHNQPLFLVVTKEKTTKLALPDAVGSDGHLNVGNSNELVLACPGKNNMLRSNKESVSTSSCNLSNRNPLGILELEGTPVVKSDLECQKRVTGRIKETEQEQSCELGNGQMFTLGFEVDKKWLNLVETCHNIMSSRTIYSKHIVYGENIAGKFFSKERPNFIRGGNMFYKGFDPNVAFSKTNQMELFQKLLGQSEARKYLGDGDKYMARGHLAPDADFLFGPWQDLTYFYINTAPQWQAINGGNWLRVENSVRNVAKKLKTDLAITTGTHGILKLKDNSYREKEIYLSKDESLPVPEYFWKAVQEPKTEKCIAFVSTNNPYLDDVPKLLCADICDEYGWTPRENLFRNSLSIGYVYCCTVNSLRHAVRYVPQLKCSSVLQGP